MFPQLRSCRNGCSRVSGSSGLCAPCERRARYDKSENTSDGTHKRVTNEEAAEMRRMRSAFMPIEAIARHFKVATSTVRIHLRKSREASE